MKILQLFSYEISSKKEIKIQVYCSLRHPPPASPRAKFELFFKLSDEFQFLFACLMINFLIKEISCEVKQMSMTALYFDEF